MSHTGLAVQIDFNSSMSEANQEIKLRPAEADDQVTIWRMVLGAGLNPLHLAWENFILAVGENDEVLGCGQIKPHGDGSRELASLYVVPEERGKGIARAIIEQLLADHPAPIWLTCRRELTDLYRRFGFEEVHAPEKMPTYFRRVRKLINLFRLDKDKDPLAVMRRR